MRNPEKFGQEIDESLTEFKKDEAAEVEEKEETTEKIDRLPEVSVSSDIIKQVAPEKQLEEDFDFNKEIDLEKVLYIVESSNNKFEALDRYLKEEVEKTPLPNEEEVIMISEGLKEKAVDNLKELGILPSDFSEESVSLPTEIELDYNPERDYGRFLHHSVVLEEDPSKKGKTSYLQIGGKVLRSNMTKLREELAQRGIEINEKDSLEISLSQLVGHEYGHYINGLYNPEDPSKEHPFAERAEEISEDKLNLDDQFEKEGVFSERFARSIADQLVTQQIESKGYSKEVAYNIRKVLDTENNSYVEKYVEMINKGKEKGYKPSDLSSLLLEIRSRLKDAGHKSVAEKIEYDCRKVGYYLPVFDREQLKYIMSK